MEISVIPFAGAENKLRLKNKTVVVIDVLRATSVMITALENGAEKIIPVLSVEEALSTTKKLEKDSYLLCGERDAFKIDGFDLGNSPLEYTPDRIKGKTIVMTTTNGTKALQACQDSKEVLIGAFMNAEAVAEKFLNIKELVLFCAGTRGRFSMDDGMCAAMIISNLSKQKKVYPDDLGKLLLNTYNYENGNLKVLLKNASHLNYLVENGFEKDVTFCLQKNTTDLIPFYDSKAIRQLKNIDEQH